MKSGAKQIVESMKGTKDRVAVMTSPCAMVNNVSATQKKFLSSKKYLMPTRQVSGAMEGRVA